MDVSPPKANSIRIISPQGPSVPSKSAYIHIPFCRHRCGYCNFSLIAGRDHLVDRFLNALEVEIRQLPESAELDTLFFGGGTPSHLEADQLQRLAAIVAQRFTLAPDAEVSAECNPSDIDREKLAALLKLGVNRISLGVNRLTRTNSNDSNETIRQTPRLGRLSLPKRKSVTCRWT